ncbi:hypothetical protein LOK49_LG13G02737 [Camellia lanceoleosa]|uniref:Uncharacterized protein n=1 Tax=Camellia lanceoleosa TaxID=1840588 RepID=A0ACC0FIT8_9ERIC|nr:hypothetical protein LOK49_LG13G02737 [Camellia lanceoleosa]
MDLTRLLIIQSQRWDLLLDLHRRISIFILLQAIDHIINSAAKSNYMSASQINVPSVFRGPNDAAVGVGAQHSQCLVAWYGACPGLKVLAPYSSEDARGLYNESFPISTEVLDSSFCLPIGKAKVEREGKDVTITTFSWMVGYAIKAAEILAKEGIIDRATINASVRKTSRLVIIEEACIFIEESFMYLDALSGKAFTTKGMQVLELVGKETMDLLITEIAIEVDKKGAQAQDDEDQLFEEVTFDRYFYIYGGPEQLEITFFIFLVEFQFNAIWNDNSGLRF